MKITSGKPPGIHRKLKKILLAMNLTAIILLSATLTVSAKGFTQKITLKEQNAPLEKVLTQIKDQSGYHLVYREEWMQEAQKVTVNLEDATLQEALNACFKGQPLSYSIVDKTIVVELKKPVTEEAVSPPPPVTIHGRIVNEHGDPVAGATVTVKGTNISTATNDNGEFTLDNVDDNAILVITGTNIETLTIAVSGRKNFNLTAKTEVSALDEVQVIPYGTQLRRFSVGNITTVKGSDIEKQPVSNPLLALEGRVPGLFITQNSGISGGAVTVRIEGQNSIQNGNTPLYVIDGVPILSELPSTGLDGVLGSFGSSNGNVAGNPLNYINPSDIESISVLKDADATAIYGSRAANGAILITTKMGIAGKTKVDLNIQQGWGKVASKLKMLNTQQYLEMRNLAFANDGKTPGASDYDLTLWDSTRYTDWQKTLIGNTAQYTNMNASVSGGTEGLQYLLGANYQRETTVFPFPSSFNDQRGSVHLSLNSISSNKKFHWQLSSIYLMDNNELPNVDLTNIAMFLEPDAPALYNSDGTLNWAPNASGNSTFNNPLQYTYNKYQNKTNNFVNNLVLNYQIIRGLNIKSSFGYSNMETKDFNAIPLLSIKPERRSTTQRSAAYGNRNLNTWIIEPQINYKHRISKGELNILAGTTIHQENSKAGYLFGFGYNDDGVLENISAATSVYAGPSSITEYRYNAFFGRLNYNWQEKYILDLTARRDGSSRFGSKSQFHNFGSVGAAWIFSEERFLRATRLLSFGKLKASYGTTGSDQIGDYKFLNSYSMPSFGNAVSYSDVSALYPEGLPNPYLEWEETRKLQGGIELGFFKNRIIIDATYTRNRCSNQLLNYSLPSIVGFSSIARNFPATVQNRNWEFAVQTTNIKTKLFSWTSSFNLTIPNNKLVAFPNLASSTYANQLIINSPLDISKHYHFLGVDPTTGRYLVADTLGNPTSNFGSIAASNVLISNMPRLYGGFQNSLKFKGFEIDFLFQFVKQKGRMIFYNNNSSLIPPGIFRSGSSNQPITVLDSWQKPGDIAIIEKYTTNLYPARFDILHVLGSDANIGDASYIRLKSLSLSWELPIVWIQHLQLEQCRFYLQGENLWTITKYKGMDPENQSITSLPPLKVLTVGLQVDF